MKTDILFHNLFEEQPELALRLAGMPAPDRAHYHFTSIELKEKAHRIDGVLVPDDYVVSDRHRRSPISSR